MVCLWAVEVFLLCAHAGKSGSFAQWVVVGVAMRRFMLDEDVRVFAREVRLLARCFVSDALSWLLCFLAAVLCLADCSTDNAGGAMYFAASLFCDKGCNDGIFGSSERDQLE